jgi:hypothetical protein
MSPIARLETTARPFELRARPRPRSTAAPGIVRATPGAERRIPARQAREAGSAGQSEGLTSPNDAAGDADLSGVYAVRLFDDSGG